MVSLTDILVGGTKADAALSRRYGDILNGCKEDVKNVKSVCSWFIRL